MGIRLATPEDSAELCAMLERAPMGEQIRLTLERRPDYFLGSAVQAEEPQVFVAESGRGEIVGVFAAGRRRVFVGGESRWIRYLSDLRIDPAHRGGRWLWRGWSHLRECVFEEDEFAQTLILRDNATILRLLTSGRAGLPRYVPAGSYQTHFLPARQAVPTSGNWTVERARTADIPEMQAFLDGEGSRKAFFPCYDFSQVGKHPYFRDVAIEDFLLARDATGELAGVTGVWDQSAFKQTRVVEYAGPMRWMRTLSRFGSGVALPPPGEMLALRYLHTILCRADNPAILRVLLAALLKEPGDLGGLMVLGLDERDPLQEALRGVRKRSYQGRHYLVTFAGSPPPVALPFYFEAARI